MTVLDAKGAAVEEDAWLADALFFWLGDERVRDALLRKGRAKPDAIRKFGGLLEAHLNPKKPLRLEMGRIRQEALNVLTDRTVRICVARQTLISQLENCERDPEAPPPQTSKEIREELQTLRLELEARIESEKLVIRP